jgi:hypothetical protein
MRAAGRACLAFKMNYILKIERSFSFSKSHSFYGLHRGATPHNPQTK